LEETATEQIIIRSVMIVTNIPNTDLQVSQICMGTGEFGGGIDPKSSYELLDAFFEKGGNFIDTAHVYNNWIPGEKSRSEKVIGKWIADRRNRGQVVISTKGAHPELDSMQVGRMSPAEIIQDLDESLAYLRVEQIDLYWLHRDDPLRPVAEVLETLNAQVKAGKIRYFGASNWRTARLREAQEYAAQHGLQPFSGDQMMWSAAVIDPQSIADQTTMVMDTGLYEYHLASGLPVLAYSSQANGLFDRIHKGTLDQMNRGSKQAYPLQANLDRFERIRQVAHENGLTINQVVLGFLLSQAFKVIPIVGPKRIDQLHDSLSAAGVSLSPQQMDFILA
jgi:aryl-alcohol dehydrogenase-like predicted oxidoreductase